MAARTLALAAGGRARAAAALGARLQPLAPPLGCRFPCPASSLLYPRAPPLLGPRGPGAPPRLGPLAPSSFHPLAFSSKSTAKGVEGQDPDEGDDGGEKRKGEAARAIDAGAKNGTKKPHDAAAAELSKKTRPRDDSTAGEISKNQPPGDGGEKSEEEAASAIDAGAKKGAKKPDDAAAELANKKTHPGDDPTAGELSKNNQPPGDVSEDAGNPEEYKGVSFKEDNPTAELAKKGHAGDDSTAGDLSPPCTPATPPCPPTVELPAPGDLSNLPALEFSTNSGELPPGNVSGDPNPKSGEHTTAEDSIAGKNSVKPTADETILKLIRAQSKENEKNVLKGVERLLENYSNIEMVRSRSNRRNQTIFIVAGVFLDIVIVVAAVFAFGIQLAVEKVRDQVHAMSRDNKTKEILWNFFDNALGYAGYQIASPIISVGSAVGAGGRKVIAIGNKIAAKLGLVKVEGGVEVEQVEAQFEEVEAQFEGLLIWCP